MGTNEKSGDDIFLIYDGDCPMCRNFSKLVRIRETVGNLHLVDARLGSPIVEEISRLGFDLDKGMVVKIGDKFYYGSDAVGVLSLLSSKNNLFNRLSFLLFKNKYASVTLYPILRFVRNILLKVRGVSKINNLKH